MVIFIIPFLIACLPLLAVSQGQRDKTLLSHFFPLPFYFFSFTFEFMGPNNFTFFPAFFPLPFLSSFSLFFSIFLSFFFFSFQSRTSDSIRGFVRPSVGWSVGWSVRGERVERVRKRAFPPLPTHCMGNWGHSFFVTFCYCQIASKALQLRFLHITSSFLVVTVYLKLHKAV